MKVIYTLRDDLYWTLPGQNIEDAVKVTSDDVIYWYDEIDGDEELQLPGYPGQFIEMPDGTSERISISRIDDRSFAFNIPRIIANPILSTNMTFGPRHIYEPAKKEGGSGALLNLFSIDTDVTTIPSIGMFHLVEYRQGVRVVMQRNPHYWKKDDSGNSYPYVERVVYRILPDKNAEYLLFLEGARDSYSVRAEDLVDLLEPEAPDYAVINGGQSLGATFFTFNQNPKSMDPIKHAWFSQTEFRQAMSCVLNRQRIADVVHRGLAEPAVHFFALANPMFDPSIELEYQYNPQKAVDLLASIDIRPDENGRMRDADGNLVEFSLVVGAENNQGIDTCAIFSDELDEIGIKARVTPVDFQALTEMLLTTYDWDVVHVALGANYWPEGGSNVWPSNGNFHLWHPLQSSPATDWEAKIDQLYNKGRFTLDDQLRKEIYDEYQRIMLEQLPVIYTVHPLSFLAVRNKWGNTSYDTLRGMELFPIYLKDEQ
ncbi:MAG: ABC transporter substrate-binding protein [Spirochaetaceae bacterium]|nr:MAG: ABC transporter substrate-binding protein [Spirochaetaceae bacterium]